MRASKALLTLVACGLAVPVYAQNEPPETNVTWEQYQDALRRIDALEQSAGANGAQPAEEDLDTAEELEELADRVDSLEGLADDLRLGTTNFLVTGYAFAGFTSNESNESSFDARFFPIFLWRLSDRVNFAGELEIELGEDETEVKLEFLDMSVVVNDNLTIRAGKILTPLSTFKEQLHSSWINKLPDQPLFATGGARLIPTSSLAVEARGAFPISDSAKIFYSAYISNGPRLVTEGGKTGQLNFSNFGDVNSGKAIGGRIGAYPMPGLDFSYAFNYADVGENDTMFEDTTAIIHDLSIGYVLEDEAINGRLDLRGEYVLSDVDDVAYDGMTFDNKRSGGYVQVAYRPSLTEGFFKDIEGVLRYDWLDNPSDAAGISKAYDEQRLTVGVNYWITPSTVLKIAYRFDNVDDPTSSKEAEDALLLQLSMGF